MNCSVIGSVASAGINPSSITSKRGRRIPDKYKEKPAELPRYLHLGLERVSHYY